MKCPRRDLPAGHLPAAPDPSSWRLIDNGFARYGYLLFECTALFAGHNSIMTLLGNTRWVLTVLRFGPARRAPPSRCAQLIQNSDLPEPFFSPVPTPAQVSDAFYLFTCLRLAPHSLAPLSPAVPARL
ncbi:hypothetical protein EVAR_64070_1 [Eumeta japonica]|uniref:Uncharacterized protein n=1 Tax=Eumeta variegata TaxID=151549 RepID=A0A4C1ZCF6_EUMVA|nr:hypothetical protein EVAR_64070_1 [Eumeta japonica]